MFTKMELKSNSVNIAIFMEILNSMEYIHRQIEEKLKKSFEIYKVVLITGTRQVGKTRFIKELFSNIKYINFDNIFDEDKARNDGLLFLNDNGVPLILDEVQRVPEIFRSIKYVCDENNNYGQYILSGSQLFKLMDEASDSLAGRVHIVELPTLSFREIKKEKFNEKFIPTEEYIDKRKKSINNINIDLWNVIQKGLYPEMQNSEKEFIDFYSDYVKTYIERDIREIIEVKNLNNFQRFLIAVAARTGEVLNTSNIASEIQKDDKTVNSWLSVLETSGIIYLLRPYANSDLKRIIKKPKIYFRDTGLACYLTRWNTKETLMNGAMSGHMFETFVVSEILKSYANVGLDYRNYLYYYNGRDNTRGQQEEIDLIIEENGTLYPIEIKMTMSPNEEMTSAFSVLQKVKNKKIGNGAIICNVNSITKIKNDLYAVPVWAL